MLQKEMVAILEIFKFPSMLRISGTHRESGSAFQFLPLENQALTQETARYIFSELEVRRN